MAQIIITEDLLPPIHNDEVVEIFYEKRENLYLNFGLMFIYVGLLVISLFII